ncbi:MAG: fructose-6-phosphate aldolase [Desulfobacterales bacterium]|nr:fructose-6-phosphate aldolase [Desulfobacterales bacterium]
MKIFLDSANTDEISSLIKRGVIRGVTTNPTLLQKEVTDNCFSHLHRIVELLKNNKLNLPLSVQVMTLEPKIMISQARKIVEQLNYSKIVIKIPIGWKELKVIKSLCDDGIQVNCTACITEAQALLAESAGARYVSFFYGKMSDIGIDSSEVLKNITMRFRETNSSCEIIVGSIRKQWDFTEISRTDAHIITLPYKYYELLSNHPKTDEAVKLFSQNYQSL